MHIPTHFRISIPKPCHEDWNEMTPDEKGAFCKVCSKSVYDFTQKSTEEIQSVLTEQISAGAKVCGRFNEEQLSETPEVPAQKEKANAWPSGSFALNFQKVKKFAMALFFVFGGYLFNSTKSRAQKLMGKIAMPQYHQPVRGEVAILRDPEPPKDTASFVPDTAAVPKIKPKCSKGEMFKGDVMIEPADEPVVGQALIEPVMGDTVITEEPVIEDEPMIMGLIAVPYDDCGAILPDLQQEEVRPDTIQGSENQIAVAESTYVEQENPVETREENISEEIISPLSLSVFPNPVSAGQITLRYELKKDALAVIRLYDMQGNLMMTLLNEQSLYASIYETKYDVSGLRDGIYFCELVSGKNKTVSQVLITK